MTHAAEVTWRRALQATRPSRSRYRARPPPGARLLGPGLAEHDGEAVLTAQADPTHRPAARAADGGPRGPRRAAAVAELGRPAGRRRPAAAASRGRRTPATCSSTCSAPGRRSCRCGRRSTRPACSTGCCPSGTLVRHRPQRNAVHRYSRRPAPASRRPCCASPLVREVRRPDLLLSPRCCTTSARASRGRPQRGGGAARRGGRHPDRASPPDDVATLALLVRHHLLLVESATRRDLDDPATVAAVADVLGTTEVLELMAALTRGRRAGHRAGAPGASGRRGSWRTSYAGPHATARRARRRRRRR